MPAEPHAASPPAAHPRSVLMTTDAIGGVWDFSLELCRGLTSRGIAVTLAGTGPAPSADQAAAAAAIEGLTLTWRELRLEWMDDSWDDVDRAGAWLLDLESQVGADVVHLNGYAHGALPWSAPVAVAAHSCVCSWWEAVRGGPAPASWDLYRNRVRAGLSGADLVVAPTRAMLAALATHHGPVHGAVVPNGRTPADYAARPKRRFVCSAGRLWDDAKNVRMLASAAPDLPWPVYVAGDPRLATGGGTCTGIGDVPRNLRLLGRLTPRDLRVLLSRAAICVLPAKYEPFGLTVLEAALSGCALVVGDIPSLRETWEDAAVFVPPDDREALVGAVRALAADDGGRADMAERARRRAERFPAERMVAGWLDVYASLRRTRLAPAKETACAS